MPCTLLRHCRGFKSAVFSVAGTCQDPAMSCRYCKILLIFTLWPAVYASALAEPVIRTSPALSQAEQALRQAGVEREAVRQQLNSLEQRSANSRINHGGGREINALRQNLRDKEYQVRLRQNEVRKQRSYLQNRTPR
jgi:hypothetical protein